VGANRRVEAQTFFGHVAYASLTARKDMPTRDEARRGQDRPKLRGKDSNLDYLIQSQASYH
jgi:hypothetical protein